MTDITNTPELSESTEPAISYSTCYKQPFRVLNCYAGIGGNRKLWNGPNMQVTAIEYDENIAKVYQDLYPNEFGAAEIEQEQQEDNSWIIAKERLTDYANWHNDKLPKEEGIDK